MARKARQVIEYRVYELMLDFPVLLHSGDKWRISPVKSGRLHFHNCLEIGICHSDSGTLEVRDAPLTFRAGDVTVIPRHVPHTTYSSPQTASLWSFIFLDFRRLLSEMVKTQEDFELTSVSEQGFVYLLDQQQYPKAHFLIMTLLDELREQRNNYRITVKALSTALYFELLRIEHSKAAGASKPAANAKDGFVITPALNHINANYMTRIDIDELAAMCHLSTTHFRRLFLSIMGTSPLSFITTTRIDRAATLLRTTEDSIALVAEAVGFASASSFNRFFMRIVGVTPSDYRKLDAQNAENPEKRSILQLSGWVEPDP